MLHLLMNQWVHLQNLKIMVFKQEQQLSQSHLWFKEWVQELGFDFSYLVRNSSWKNLISFCKDWVQGFSLLEVGFHVLIHPYLLVIFKYNFDFLNNFYLIEHDAPIIFCVVQLEKRENLNFDGTNERNRSASLISCVVRRAKFDVYMTLDHRHQYDRMWLHSIFSTYDKTIV